MEPALNPVILWKLLLLGRSAEISCEQSKTGKKQTDNLNGTFLGAWMLLKIHICC